MPTFGMNFTKIRSGETGGVIVEGETKDENQNPAPVNGVTAYVATALDAEGLDEALWKEVRHAGSTEWEVDFPPRDGYGLGGRVICFGVLIDHTSPGSPIQPSVWSNVLTVVPIEDPAKKPNQGEIPDPEVVLD